ncbi:hypothetical protein SLEP1_g20404 [Rubroshorea leprosula]|uniref:Uncharacterized protein n=1 Tax=Rubroshorea leprosula TaxID=152421 RepID=A0AAV5J2L1_9ROSI|nr:hypothetical protein SLEP1_g20404 [Rubroshorea leprosula]
MTQRCSHDQPLYSETVLGMPRLFTPWYLLVLPIKTVYWMVQTRMPCLALEKV